MLGLLDGTRAAIYDSTEFVGGEMGGGRWMRQGDYKAVMIPPPYGSGVWQLFNVVEDPGEAEGSLQTDAGETRSSQGGRGTHTRRKSA